MLLRKLRLLWLNPLTYPDDRDVVADDLPRPCGACLQVLTEFCEPELRVILASAAGAREVARLADLLPRPFKLEQRD